MATGKRESTCEHGSGRLRVKEKDINDSPWRRATPVWTMMIEVIGTREQDDTFWVPLALDRKTLVYVLAIFEESKEPSPESAAFFGIQERMGVADQDEAVSGT